MNHHQIKKYPRTRHIEGSRLQPGDEDLNSVRFADLKGLHLVVEEKVDGANCAISFSPDGNLLLQSRGHYLTGGGREKHFNLFKQWAAIHTSALWALLGTNLIMYGEWLYAKHTIYYNLLPHYFMEFDIYDKVTKRFLDTPTRQALLQDSPIVSVRVIAADGFDRLEDVYNLVGRSAFIEGNHIEELRSECTIRRLDPGRAVNETDKSDLMEGLYIKHEEGGRVIDRYKWVRASFLTAVFNSEGHWLNRPIIPNKLAPGVKLFES